MLPLKLDRRFAHDRLQSFGLACHLFDKYQADVFTLVREGGRYIVFRTTRGRDWPPEIAPLVSQIEPGQ